MKQDQTIIAKVASKLELSTDEVAMILSTYYEVIAELLQGDPIVDTEMVRFLGVTWPSVSGENPSTGAVLTIPARNAIEINANSKFQKMVKDYANFVKLSTEIYKAKLEYDSVRYPEKSE